MEEENCGDASGVAASDKGDAGSRETETAGEDGAESGSRRPGAGKRDVMDNVGDAAADGLEERLVTELALRAAMEELETDAREMILLRYVNEVPVGVIGEIYGISRFAVYRKIRESLSLLREKLGEEDFT